MVIGPGKSAAITVKITPAGASGTAVSGVLNIVTTPQGVAGIFNTTGDVIATTALQLHDQVGADQSGAAWRVRRHVAPALGWADAAARMDDAPTIPPAVDVVEEAA